MSPLFIRPARFTNGVARRGKVRDLRNRPHVIGDARSHCRGNAERLMNAREIVVHHVQRDGERVVLDLL